MESKNLESEQTVITIGTFDGVHIGHQKIIEKLVSVGENKNLKPTVLTFFPHPRMVLQKDANIKLINTMDEKESLLKGLGLRNMVVEKFTKEFSRLSAEDFVKKLLVDKLNVKYIIIGYDHHFGRNRSANINDLITFGKQYGFEVEEISAQDINDVAVSSTKIRNALNEGQIITANDYLGYPYMLTGKVVKGKGIGKTISFPTANIEISEAYKLIPKEGVYIVKSIINNDTVFGMMNIGTNPTVQGNSQTIEVHFFNWNSSLYNKKMKIELLERLRDEVKFKSIDALKTQLHLDQQQALQYIAAHAK